MPSDRSAPMPMDELLPAATAAVLAERGVRVIHPAFALTVPAALNPELFP